MTPEEKASTEALEACHGLIAVLNAAGFEKGAYPFQLVDTIRAALEAKGAEAHKTYHVLELSEDDLRAIENAKMPEGFEHLNAEMGGEQTKCVLESMKYLSQVAQTHEKVWGKNSKQDSVRYLEVSYNDIKYILQPAPVGEPIEALDEAIKRLESMYYDHNMNIADRDARDTVIEAARRYAKITGGNDHGK